MKRANQSHGAYNHVLRYTSLFGGVQGFNMLMSFVRNKVVAVLLGSVGIGLIDLYNRTLSFLTAITSLIAPVASVRVLSVAHESEDVDELNKQIKIVRSWTLLTAIVAFTLCIIFSPLISEFTFHDYLHMHRVIALSPILPLVAISGSELSILKATRQLSRLAWSSFYGAIALAAISIPLYFLLGTTGIVPALVLSTAAVCAIQLCYTLPLHPWHVSPFKLSVLRQGKSLVHLSIMYTLAGIAASASELIIRSFIVSQDKVSMVGLYSAGIIITIAAAKFLFVAMDADYFPRLSGCCKRNARMNVTINRQLEVCVLLLAPFLIVFNMFMPFIVRLLFSSQFLSIVPMAILATFYMFCKAITTPIAYLPLAHSDGHIYFLLETSYYVLFSILVITFYYFWQLPGAGIALSLSNIIENVGLSLIYHKKYRFSYSHCAQQIILLQGILVVAGVILALNSCIFLKYSAGTVVFIVSLLYSYHILSKRSTIRGIFKRQ